MFGRSSTTRSGAGRTGRSTTTRFEVDWDGANEKLDVNFTLDGDVLNTDLLDSSASDPHKPGRCRGRLRFRALRPRAGLPASVRDPDQAPARRVHLVRRRSPRRCLRHGSHDSDPGRGAHRCRRAAGGTRPVHRERLELCFVHRLRSVLPVRTVQQTADDLVAEPGRRPVDVPVLGHLRPAGRPHRGDGERHCRDG